MQGVWPLLIESALILLQTVPTHIDVDKLKKRLLNEIDGVLAIHEFHVWQLTGDRIIASAHIRCLNLSEYMKVRQTTVANVRNTVFFIGMIPDGLVLTKRKVYPTSLK
jgi:Co/Zn/Cd efflux system component